MTSIVAICANGTVAAKDVTTQQWDARMQKRYDFAAGILSIPQVGTKLAKKQPLFCHTNIVECGLFLVENKSDERINQSRNERHILIYDSGKNEFAIGRIYEALSYSSACLYAIMCTTQTSMPFDVYVHGLALRKDIGDFCIFRRENGDNPDRLYFVRGHVAVSIRKNPSCNGSLFDLAKAIDEAILSDSEGVANGTRTNNDVR